MSEIVIALLCIIVFILSLIGNFLVISVIIRYKRLKNATNYILLSLAIADLTVTFCVMLPATIQDILQEWIWSEFFCKFYIALDITCCTASILHLLLVAVDRYIAIFNPLTYQNMIRKWHILAMVIMVWTISFCMSFIPIFMGWNELAESTLDVLNTTNTTKFSINQTISTRTVTLIEDSLPENFTKELPKTCYMAVNVPYAIISSSLSFYIPVIIMSIVYSKIYIIAKRQAKQIAQLDLRLPTYQDEKSSPEEYLKDCVATKNQKNNLINELLEENKDNKVEKSIRFNGLVKSLKKIEKKQTKDKKAIKTLGIIMGIFTFCWLPFFLMYLFVPIFNWPIPIFYERLITWIGYVNSFINPIVYALTSRDFRKAYIATLKAVYESIGCAKSSNDFYNASPKRFSWFGNSKINNKQNHTNHRHFTTRKQENVDIPEKNEAIPEFQNHVEKEITKLVNQEVDAIVYIDEQSDTGRQIQLLDARITPTDDQMKHLDMERSNSGLSKLNYKAKRKKSYLDFADDDSSLEEQKFDEEKSYKYSKQKIQSSLSIDDLRRSLQRQKGIRKFSSAKKTSFDIQLIKGSLKNTQQCDNKSSKLFMVRTEPTLSKLFMVRTEPTLSSSKPSTPNNIIISDLKKSNQTEKSALKVENSEVSLSSRKLDTDSDACNQKKSTKKLRSKKHSIRSSGRKSKRPSENMLLDYAESKMNDNTGTTGDVQVVVKKNMKHEHNDNFFVFRI